MIILIKARDVECRLTLCFMGIKCLENVEIQ